MSYAYTNQPATKGKIIIATSGGDLEVELWPKEAPIACRNFIQLCMEGYYDNCPIHRIVPNFIVQTGDPTGTGLGGESIYGKDFVDEYHSRIRFTQRGLLGMANTGRDTNKSQFFFTLAATPELTGKNTIFGRIVGDTLFNLLKLGELQTDKDERPIFDARIITTKILSNPFEDIVPRTTREERLIKQKEQERLNVEEERKNKPKGTKNLALLSFGDDKESKESIPKVKIQSSHDVLESDSRLSKQLAVEVPIDVKKQKRKAIESVDQSTFDQEKVIAKKVTLAATNDNSKL
jgi:peptidyl-prolyl cis-trans isomerase SDCCAG10